MQPALELNTILVLCGEEAYVKKLLKYLSKYVVKTATAKSEQIAVTISAWKKNKKQRMGLLTQRHPLKKRYDVFTQ